MGVSIDIHIILKYNVVVEIYSYFKILDPRTGNVMEEIFNDDPAYKDDFKYSYGNDKQGIDITMFNTKLNLLNVKDVKRINCLIS